MRSCEGYCDECHHSCSATDDAIEIQHLRKIVEALGEALGDIICEATSTERYITWTGGVRVPPSWGNALRVHDEVYVAWLDGQGD